MALAKFTAKPLGQDHSCPGKILFLGVAVSACWQSAASRPVGLRDTPKKRIFPGQLWSTNINYARFIHRRRNRGALLSDYFRIRAVKSFGRERKNSRLEALLHVGCPV